MIYPNRENRSEINGKTYHHNLFQNHNSKSAFSTLSLKKIFGAKARIHNHNSNNNNNNKNDNACDHGMIFLSPYNKKFTTTTTLSSPSSSPSFFRQYSTSSLPCFASKIKIGDDEYDEIYEYINFDPLSSSVRKQRRVEARKILYERKGGEGKETEYLLSPSIKRCGVVALKVGMMGVYDSWGERHTCTVLQLDNVEVTQCKQLNTDGQLSAQLGISEKKVKNTKKPQKGHFEKAGVAPKRRLAEFQVNSEDCLVPLGTKIDVRHFIPGQYVDVQ